MSEMTDWPSIEPFRKLGETLCPHERERYRQEAREVLDAALPLLHPTIPNTVHLGDYDRIWGPGISITEAEKEAVARYRTALLSGWHGLAPEMLHELRGKDLACWCGPGHRCHADVLLELANREAAP